MWESLARCCFYRARASGARDRRFKSDHPDFRETYSGGSCVGTGRRLLIAQTQVRFLLPEPFRSVNCEVRSLKFRTSNLSLQTSSVPLAERQSSGLPIRSGRFDSDMALCFALVIYRCGPTVSQLPLKQWYVGSTPSARACGIGILPVNAIHE